MRIIFDISKKSLFIPPIFSIRSFSYAAAITFFSYGSGTDLLLLRRLTYG